ncbi:MAG TPA: hypothetical protein VLH37_00845 [Bacteroidales bacterium]|nr:hypothetical protein [Bacteroidales bacterium]
MKATKIRFNLTRIFITGVFLAFAICCKKDDNAQTPLLAIFELTVFAWTTPQCGGMITSEESLQITGRGVCLNTKGNPTIAYNRTSDVTGIGSYKSKSSSLTASKTCYVRAYAANRKAIAYGNTFGSHTLCTICTETRVNQVFPNGNHRQLKLVGKKPVTLAGNLSSGIVFANKPSFSCLLL